MKPAFRIEGSDGPVVRQLYEDVQKDRPDRINALAVESLLKDVWPKAVKYPSLNVCNTLAIRLRIVRDKAPSQDPETAETKRAQAAGRSFLEFAPDMRQQLLKELRMYAFTDEGSDQSERLVVIDRERYERCKAALSDLEQAQRNVKAALEAWSGRDPLRIVNDPVHFIADAVRKAWTDIGMPEITRNANDRSKLAEFVSLALGLAGVAYTPSGVSGRLLGRNTRPPRPRK